MYRSNQRQPHWKAGYLGNRENQSLTCAHVRRSEGDSGGSVDGGGGGCGGGVLGYLSGGTGVGEGLGCRGAWVAGVSQSRGAMLRALRGVLNIPTHWGIILWLLLSEFSVLDVTLLI